GVVPGLHARVRGPPLVVERVAALEDHPVDAAGAAQHLAARVVNAAVVHERLGLRLVFPVVEPGADRERQRRRHVDAAVDGELGDRVLRRVSGDDVAGETAALVSTAAIGASFGPGLLPRGGTDQAIATGIVGATQYGLVVTSQSLAAALAKAVARRRGTPWSQFVAQAGVTAGLVGLGT